MQHIWHPCTQMKDHEIFALLEVVAAKNCYIELANGKKIIDAISSWWCKSLGHHHPRLKDALFNQIEKFEHVIMANTTNETIITLSEKLAQLTTSLNKVFYAGDGSSAVEIAMKMSLHARQNQNNAQRQLFVALENSYHGETIGALSVSDVGLYRDPYAAMLFETYFISGLPYVTGVEDPLWRNCEAHWKKTEEKLELICNDTTAIIVEPLVQGAGGMKIYSQDFLKRLRIWTAQHDIHLIADEIMTGIGRTGKMLACQHAGIEPDFLCLSKGLTSGWMAFSAVLTTQKIYDLFYDDYAAGKAFLHSHTYSGNALAASIALEVLNIFAEEKICERVDQINILMHQFMLELAEQTGKLANVRSFGAITAAELVGFPEKRRIGFELAQQAAELGVLLRPLGNTLYWLPPLTIDECDLRWMRDLTGEAIRQL